MLGYFPDETICEQKIRYEHADQGYVFYLQNEVSIHADPSGDGTENGLDAKYAIWGKKE